MEKIRDIVIYKLESRNPTILPFYIGSTCNLYNRCAGHKTACKRENNKKYNFYLYEFIRDFGGFDSWRMVPLYKGKGTLKEKKVLEKKYIDMYKPQLNKAVIGRTIKQYRKDNKDKINLQIRINRVKNIEKHREQLKKSYHNNKAKRAEYAKKYWMEKKDEINKKNNELMPCICGAMVKAKNRIKHRKSEDHKEKIKCVFYNNALFNYRVQQTKSPRTRRKIRTIKKKKQENRRHSKRR